MRIFLTALVLIFSLQSWAKADDIRDFEIEGMSVGDSLLNYFSKEQIKKNISGAQYDDKEFILYYFKWDFHPNTFYLYTIFHVLIYPFHLNSFQNTFHSLHRKT